jgi:hypothetical protein
MTLGKRLILDQQEGMAKLESGRIATGGPFKPGFGLSGDVHTSQI